MNAATKQASPTTIDRVPVAHLLKTIESAFAEIEKELRMRNTGVASDIAVHLEQETRFNRGLIEGGCLLPEPVAVQEGNAGDD